MTNENGQIMDILAAIGGRFVVAKMMSPALVWINKNCYFPQHQLDFSACFNALEPSRTQLGLFTEFEPTKQLHTYTFIATIYHVELLFVIKNLQLVLENSTETDFWIRVIQATWIGDVADKYAFVTNVAYDSMIIIGSISDIDTLYRENSAA